MINKKNISLSNNKERNVAGSALGASKSPSKKAAAKKPAENRKVNNRDDRSSCGRS